MLTERRDIAVLLSHGHFMLLFWSNRSADSEPYSKSHRFTHGSSDCGTRLVAHWPAGSKMSPKVTAARAHCMPMMPT